MKVLLINGSPRAEGNTALALKEMEKIFAQEGMPFSHYAVLDGDNFYEAKKLVMESDLIVLAGGHLPTQNAFFHKIHLFVKNKHLFCFFCAFFSEICEYYVKK